MTPPNCKGAGICGLPVSVMVKRIRNVDAFHNAQIALRDMAAPIPLTFLQISHNTHVYC